MIKNVLIILILASVYFVSAKLGLLLAFVNQSATAVWPPTGISIAAFLIFGYKIWPGIFLGAFLANVTTAGTIITSLGIATGNTLEGFIAAYLVQKFANGRFVFEKPGDIFKFAYLAGLIATTISATIGVTTLSLAGLSNLYDFFNVWLTWWLGDLAGALVITPLILSWINHRNFSFNIKESLELIGLIITLLSVSQIVFGWIPSTNMHNYPIDFLVFPVLLWAAFRFGVRETATMTFLLSVIAILATLRGHGPFVRSSPNESLLLLQAFMSIVTIMMVLISSLVSEHKRLDKDKDEFILKMSHDIKTPLAIIRSLSSMITQGKYGSFDKSMEKPMNNISEYTLKLVNLMDDLVAKFQKKV